MRARVGVDVAIDERHERFFALLSQIKSPWGFFARHSCPPVPDIGSSLVVSSNVGKLLGSGIRGHVYYQFRGGIRDDAGCDDFVDLTFNVEKFDFAELVFEVFPKYITAFDPYVAYLRHDEFTLHDIGRHRQMQFNTRRDVDRIFPAMFFDEVLCLRAFKASIDEVRKQLSGKVKIVNKTEKGLYVVSDDRPLSFEETDKRSLWLRSQILS